MSTPRTIFDVLNARHVAPSQIADTFIAPSQFRQLIQPGNSLLVGARGTGKTTLLKMLKLPAFERWESAAKSNFSLNYVSAFVSNDRNWSSRINDFALQFQSEELQTRARLALVSNQTLRAVLRSIAELFDQSFASIPLLGEFRLDDALSAEVAFARQFSESISAARRALSVVDIQHSLASRIDRLVEDANAMRFTGESEQEVSKRHRWIFSEFLTPIEKAITIFREVTGLSDPPWCLCFDELELAHQDVRNLLFSYLRGSNPSFYFKLATVPFIEDISAFRSFNAPIMQHDFSVVELWNVKKEQGSDFMRQLAQSLLERRNIMGVSLEQVLGDSLDVRSRGEAAGRYSEGSRFFEHFLSLADQDPSFRRFLSDRKIGIHDFYKMSENRRAAIFRKIQSVVVLRSTFLPKSRPSNIAKSGSRARRRQTRGSVYSGAQDIIDMCDNNPRFLLAVLDPLVTEYTRTTARVKPELQLEAITQVSNQVMAVLKGEAIYPASYQMKSVADLVQRLGRFFRQEVHGGAFNPDPVLSFTISKAAPEALIKAVGFAIREGAMLLEGDYVGSYLLNGLSDKRVRLAYLFAPEYLLPLILGRPRNLDGLVNTRRPKSQGAQQDFFQDENDEE
ncbi:hypothetical protein ABIG06_002756 [Bradyrhizobium sp. USDA 326]|uniref:ORC-CDC6 family AAA ATPase n=1 Tax=unclassified Bradyrhizobium TaxID=2631580 RepID=UPI00351199C2